MAAYEKPANEFDYSKGNQPEVMREDEEFIYKFMSQKEKPKKVEKTIDDAVDGDDTDPELEAFAQKEIEAQMKRMNGGIPDDSDEDVDIDYSSDEEQGETQLQEDSNEDVSEEVKNEDGFFSDEGLSEVNLSQGGADESAEQFSEDEEEYGSESEQAVEEDLLPETDNGKKGKKQEQKPKKSAFAAYEDFAHLLEEGIDEREDTSKERKHFAN